MQKINLNYITHLLFLLYIHKRPKCVLLKSSNNKTQVLIWQKRFCAQLRTTKMDEYRTRYMIDKKKIYIPGKYKSDEAEIKTSHSNDNFVLKFNSILICSRKSWFYNNGHRPPARKRTSADKIRTNFLDFSKFCLPIYPTILNLKTCQKCAKLKFWDTYRTVFS